MSAEDRVNAYLDEYIYDDCQDEGCMFASVIKELMNNVDPQKYVLLEKILADKAGLEIPK